jgi:hypothetical protein
MSMGVCDIFTMAVSYCCACSLPVNIDKMIQYKTRLIRFLEIDLIVVWIGRIFYIKCYSNYFQNIVKRFVVEVAGDLEGGDLRIPDDYFLMISCG